MVQTSMQQPFDNNNSAPQHRAGPNQMGQGDGYARASETNPLTPTAAQNTTPSSHPLQPGDDASRSTPPGDAHNPQDDNFDPEQYEDYGDDPYGQQPPPANPMQKYIVAGASILLAGFVLWWLLGAGNGVVVAGSEHDEKNAKTPDIAANTNTSSDTAAPSADGKKMGDKKDTQKTVPDIGVVELTAVDYKPQLLATGVSAPLQQTTIKSAIGGRLERKMLRENVPVKTGGVIAQFEIAANAAKLNAAQKQLQLLEIGKNSEMQLAAQGLSSNLNMAKADSDLANARAQVTELTRVVNELKVKAPFNGVVTEYLVEVGDLISPGQPLANFAALQQLYIDLFLSLDKTKDLKVGATAEVTVGDVTKTATVNYVGVVSDQNTSTVKIRLLMNNEDGKVKGQAPASVSITLPAIKAYDIPPTALNLGDSGKIGIKVLAADNKVAFQPITILAQDSDHVWVTGLPEKIILLTEGQAFVSVGQTINPVYKK